ncbi:MAG: type II toxin-antitoxin system HicB family antitoxin [Chloroflexi bacterium]|nr:type II toxin-antitoxin system HicB family antitoxin [Chloroflexota bacterium]
MPKYLVYITSAREEGYIASCPDLPGCAAQGETVEETLKAIKYTINGYIASLKRQGGAIPEGVEDRIQRVEVVKI